MMNLKNDIPFSPQNIIYYIAIALISVIAIILVLAMVVPSILAALM